MTSSYGDDALNTFIETGDISLLVERIRDRKKKRFQQKTDVSDAKRPHSGLGGGDASVVDTVEAQDYNVTSNTTVNKTPLSSSKLFSKIISPDILKSQHQPLYEEVKLSSVKANREDHRIIYHAEDVESQGDGDGDVMVQRLNPLVRADQEMLSRVLQGEQMHKISDGRVTPFVFRVTRDYQRLTWSKSFEGLVIASNCNVVCGMPPAQSQSVAMTVCDDADDLRNRWFCIAGKLRSIELLASSAEQRDAWIAALLTYKDQDTQGSISFVSGW